mgnify:CR=1 FL=1
MKKRSVRIRLDDEQVARHIALLVQKASKYESAIYIQSGEKRVNAKSIMGMMTLGMDIREDLNVSADGVDEEAAIEGITDFLSGKEI